MNPIHITVTGHLGDEPRTFTVRDDTPGVELRLAIDLPPRGADGREVTRWVKVTAFGVLASHTAASVHKGDRVTVIADDFKTESWIARDSDPNDPQARGQITLRAIEISASMRHDTLSTGRAARKAARAAAANGEATDLPAGEQADLQVLAGVTATS
jgi:single-stranded DNA-binding protein